MSNTNRTTLALKISIEANRISREYIEVLAKGNEPAKLAAIIHIQRYGIMDHIDDARANMSNTIEKIRVQAHYLIKMDLQANPLLAQRLIGFRAARIQRDNQEAMSEQRNWKSLPAFA